MFYKIIITYLSAIVLTILFNIDLSFIIFITIMSFIILLILLKTYKRHFNFKKELSFIVILGIVFSISSINTKNNIVKIEAKNTDSNKQIIVGKVVSLTPKADKKSLIIKTNENSKYVETSVSEYLDVELYDTVSLEGEMKLKNFEVFYEQSPLFFSYEYEHVFYNADYTVSYPSNISVTKNELEFSETIIKYFKKVNLYLNSKFEKHMNEPYASIAASISTGNQNNLSKNIKDIFRDSGLIHIMVLSGANVSFIISIIWYFLRNIKSKYKVYLTIFFAWIFIVVTGLHPPSIRAGVMSSTNILAEYFSKNISTINSLLISLFILTIFNPLTLLYSASLHLSFLACLSIFILAPYIEKKLEKIISFKFLRFLLATSISIFLGTTPYILALVGSASIFGSMLTIFIEPIIFMSTILSFLMIFFSSIFSYSVLNFLGEFFGNILGTLNTICVKIILTVAEFGANNFSLINFKIPAQSIILYYFIFILLVLRIQNSKNDIILANKTESKAE